MFSPVFCHARTPLVPPSLRNGRRTALLPTPSVVSSSSRASRFPHSAHFTQSGASLDFLPGLSPSGHQPLENLSSCSRPSSSLASSLNRLVRAHHHAQSLKEQLDSGVFFSQANHALGCLNSTFTPAFSRPSIVSQLAEANSLHIQRQ